MAEDVDTHEPREERTVRVSGACVLSDDDIRLLITRANEAAGYESAAVTFSFERGQMVTRGALTIRRAHERPPASAIALGGRRLPSIE